MDVAAGSNQDVVLHLPASVGGAAVVTAYQTPVEPIGPGKARVLVAHTATVAPADVQVDGKVVFSNIANGEFATADVPAGKHVVALFPTGETGRPDPRPADRRPRARSRHHGLRRGQPGRRLDGPGRAHGRARRGRHLVPADDRHRLRGARGRPPRRRRSDARPPEVRSRAMGGKRVRRRASATRRPGARRGRRRRGRGWRGGWASSAPTRRPRPTTPWTSTGRSSATPRRRPARRPPSASPSPATPARERVGRPEAPAQVRLPERHDRAGGRGVARRRRAARRPRGHPHRRAGGAAARGSATPSGRR